MAPPSPMSPLFPVNRQIFRTNVLDTAYKNQLINLVQSVGKMTLRNAHSVDEHHLYAIHTDPASQRRMKLVFGKDAHDLTNSCMVGHTQFNATLEEVAEYYRNEAISQDVLDSYRLCTINGPSPSDPLRYVGIHWTAYKISNASSRDFCYLESHSEFIDQSGSVPRRGWLRSIHSIEYAGCPSLLTTHGLVRSRLFRSGHVFLEGSGGVVDCYAVLSAQFDNAIASSNNILMSFMRKWVTSVLNLPNLFLERRLSSTPLLPDDALRNKDSIKLCMICTARFHIFQVKHHCRACGQVICGSCHIQWKIQDSKVRICVKCIEGSSGRPRCPTKSNRESITSTWTSSTRSTATGRRTSATPKQLTTLASTSRHSMSSETASIDLTIRSECSDDLVLLDPIDFPSKPIQNEQFDNFVDPKILRDHRESPPCYSESIVDLSVLQRERKPAEQSIALHHLLQQMYDKDSPIIRNLYQDLLSQGKTIE